MAKKQPASLQSEPDAGGDLGSMRTAAVRDGDKYIINGTKRWMTGAEEADFAQLLAVTDKDRGSRGGISLFLVDMDAPGVKITAKYETMMGDQPCEIHFDNVAIPIEHRVGEEGRGIWSGAEVPSTRTLKTWRKRRWHSSEVSRHDVHICQTKGNIWTKALR